MYAYLGQALTPPAGGLALQNISGALSGTYTKKEYHVTANCSVASGVDVTFEAGSQLHFDGDFYIEVIGQIQFNGTASERIVLKPSTTNVADSWHGVMLCDYVNLTTFSGGENNTDNRFLYCDFIKAKKLSDTGSGNYHWVRGAAIFAYLFELLRIEDCTFTDCTGWDYGGTIYLHGETGHTTTFKRNVFTRCICQNEAAGAWVLTHGTYAVEGCSYVSCEGRGFGQNMSYTVDTTTNLFTTSDHYQITGNIVKFPAAANAPAPCVTGVEYYAIIVSGTTFRLASSLANAFAGTAIDITAQASGSKVMNILQEYSGFDTTITITV